MRLPSKTQAGLGTFGLLVLLRILEYIVDTIIRLNVETAAQKVGLDDEISTRLRWVAVMKQYILETVLPSLQQGLDFLTGPYAIGFVAGALFVGFSDRIWYVASRPRHWYKAIRARRRTGRIVLLFKKKIGSNDQLIEGQKVMNIHNNVGELAGYEPPLASVLVQCGYADYTFFWDEWHHQDYQKMARGKDYRILASDSPQVLQATYGADWQTALQSRDYLRLYEIAALISQQIPSLPIVDATTKNEFQRLKDAIIMGDIAFDFGDLSFSAAWNVNVVGGKRNLDKWKAEQIDEDTVIRKSDVSEYLSMKGDKDRYKALTGVTLSKLPQSPPPPDTGQGKQR